MGKNAYSNGSTQGAWSNGSYSGQPSGNFFNRNVYGGYLPYAPPVPANPWDNTPTTFKDENPVSPSRPAAAKRPMATLSAPVQPVTPIGYNKSNKVKRAGVRNAALDNLSTALRADSSIPSSGSGEE